jgi:two-component system cell cycle sensor histidine kinase/response regulator CckA
MPTRPIRVLHLEDSLRDAELIRGKLDLAGVSCDVVLTNSRESFDAALRRQSFDLVLCDYNVPGYDGVSALTRVKEVQPEAPVIIISGTVGEEEAVKCLHAGATDYLLKQRLERLAAAVRRAIQETDDRRRRKEAEDALLQRERRLSSIYEAVADMLFYLAVEDDGGYRFLSVNPAFVSATGLAYDRVIGERIETVFPRPTLATAIDHFDRARRERRVVRWEASAEFPAGELTGDVSVAPVFDAAGRCTHLVGAVHDLTERRQLEAQLRHAQKMESVGQLAGGIAHDFNNLLTVINGLAQLVLEQVKDGDEQLREDMEEIRRAGERAAALTRQLLTFSRKQILQPQILDLNVVVAEMIGMLRRLLGEDVELSIRAANDPLRIKADRGQIEQVLANLAVNARDAMPSGGSLVIDTRQMEIGAASEQHQCPLPPGRYVVLTVSDTGTGMDESTRQRIFEPFFTTKGPGRGTGLGLSTVYGIVKETGGFIKVESTVGRGSSFTIYLPLAMQPSIANGSSTGTASTGTETILIVEDVVGLRTLIARALKSAGYNVLLAATGDEALQLLERTREPVHLVVTDVVMPGMNGRTLADRIRMIRPDTKVLYMSGYTDDVVVRHGVSSGTVPFVSKPFDQAELMRTIRRVLDELPHAH